MSNLRCFFEEVDVRHVLADGSTFPVAAGTTDVNSAAIDALDRDRLAVLATYGDNADTGTMTMKIQGSANGTDGWTDITGATQSFTAGASDTDHEMQGIEIDVNPAYRYYRVAFDRGTANVVIAALQAFLFKAGRVPLSQGTGTGQFVSAPVIVAG